MKSFLRWVNAHPSLTVFIIALLLRVPFIDGSVDFFDSPQYLWRSLVPNFFDALSSGHAPYHPGYVGWIWLGHQLLPGLAIAKTAALVNALFSTLGLVGIFLLADRLIGRRVAWLATALMALTPYYWVGSITILVDPVMLAGWIGSLWAYLVWLDERPKRSYIAALPWLIGAGLLLGLAILAHTQIAFWSLGFVALILIRRSPREWLRTALESLPFLIGPLLAIAGYVGLLIRAEHNPDAASALAYLLGGNAGDHAPFALDLTIRNTRLVLGSVFALGALIASSLLIKGSPKLGWPLALWLWPGAIVSSAYIYTNLSGRATMAAVVPASIAVAAVLVPAKGRLSHWQLGGVWLILASLALGSTPLVWGYATGLSFNEAMDRVRTELPQGGEYLASPEGRTLTSYDHSLFVYDDSQSAIEDRLRAAVAEGKPTFVGSDAVTFPIYAYDGRSLRVFVPPATRGDHGSQASFLFNEFTATPTADASGTPGMVYALARPGTANLTDRYTKALESLEVGSRMVLGRIVDDGGPVSRLEVNVHGAPATNPLRIDAHDWLANLIRTVGVAVGYQTTDPLNWSYTDPEGVVAVKLPPNTEARSFRLVPHPLDTARTQSPPPLFVRPEATQITQGIETFEGSAYEFAERLEGESGSILASVEALGNNRFRATITTTNYELQTANSVPGGVLPGQVGEIDQEQRRIVAAGTVGDATFGPWKKLAPGMYSVTWALNRTDEGEGTVAKLDVSSGFGAETLTEQFVDAAELPVGKSTAITREFEVTDTTNLLEFRTRALGGPGFVVESLIVERQ